LLLLLLSVNQKR